MTAEQVREWCANPDAQITVQPVLDLADHIHVSSYQASARLKLQTQLRDGTCVFAFCFRPAEDCDCEHRVPHEDDGPTCSCNQAPCCRRHHRAKTTGGWTYLTVEPGVYLWRSPLGYQFLRDHTGTLDVTPTRNTASSPAPSSRTSTPDHPAPHPAQPSRAGIWRAEACYGNPCLVEPANFLRAPTRTASPSRRLRPARCPRSRPCPAQQRVVRLGQVGQAFERPTSYSAGRGSRMSSSVPSGELIATDKDQSSRSAALLSADNSDVMVRGVVIWSRNAATAGHVAQCSCVDSLLGGPIGQQPACSRAGRHDVRDQTGCRQLQSYKLFGCHRQLSDRLENAVGRRRRHDLCRA